MKCCINCFTDSIIVSEIEKKGRIGNCDYCDNQATTCINTKELQNYFSVIASIYYPATEEEEGDVIDKLLTEDWNIVSKDVYSPENLVHDILENDDSSNYLYVRPEKNYSHTNKWVLFKNEIISNNRFFPGTIPPKHDMELLFNFLSTPIHIGDIYYRSRIQESLLAYENKEMGNPPAEKVQNGRVNPVGISYLYLASNEKTAIHEVRPHIGNLITLAEVRIEKELNLVDLRNPEATLSPFKFDEDDLMMLYRDLDFLMRLSSELSSPIIPSKINTGYLPSQYLCEMIKIAGYDGVAYKSSMNPSIMGETGFNIAIFDDKVISINEDTKSIKVIGNDLTWHTFT